jgi:hypothetical protein
MTSETMTLSTWARQRAEELARTYLPWSNEQNDLTDKIQSALLEAYEKGREDRIAAVLLSDEDIAAFEKILAEFESSNE